MLIFKKFKNGLQEPVLYSHFPEYRTLSWRHIMENNTCEICKASEAAYNILCKGHFVCPFVHLEGEECDHVGDVLYMDFKE
jgi:hypothetical protein